MKYFKTKINTQKDSNEIITSLKTLMIKPSNEIFVFPFCYFQKSFYQQIRKNKQASYVGKIKQMDFEFFKDFRYGNLSSGSTTRTVKINGQIRDENNMRSVTIEFSSPNFEIVIELILIVTLLTIYILKGNIIFLIIPIIALIEKVWYTWRNYLIIRNRIKK